MEGPLPERAFVVSATARSRSSGHTRLNGRDYPPCRKTGADTTAHGAARRIRAGAPSLAPPPILNIFLLSAIWWQRTALLAENHDGLPGPAKTAGWPFSVGSYRESGVAT
jgi:hypothetical protein